LSSWVAGDYFLRSARSRSFWLAIIVLGTMGV